MSDGLRDAIQAAARAEPAVGDPYERFLRRRRRSRGLRTLFGFALAALTMFGFVRVFPGGAGVTPNEGLFPGAPVQPGFDPYEVFESEPLAVSLLIPSEWRTEALPSSARVGPVLSDTATPDGLEIRFGDLGGCAATDCVALADAVERPGVLRSAGIDAREKVLRVGSLSQPATELRFPDRADDAVAPWCAGCVAYYAEIGPQELPMLIVAPNEASLQANSSLLRLVLRTVVAR